MHSMYSMVRYTPLRCLAHGKPNEQQEVRFTMSGNTPAPPVINGDASAARATPTIPSSTLSGQALAAAEAAAAVNYVDVKIHKISQLPASFFAESGSAPLFSDHPFRYELSCNFGGSPASANGKPLVFSNGRLLTPMPLYEQAVSLAQLPPAEIGPLDSSRAADVPAEVRPPPPRVPSTIGEEGGSAAQGAAPSSATASPVAAPPELLWVLTPECDAVEWRELEGVKKDTKPAPKGAKGGAAAAASAAAADAAASAVVKLTLPNANAPTPCVGRQLLSPQQQQDLESKVEQGVPLQLTFRRVMRSNAPVDWEDTQESRYAASVMVPLAALREPGATTLTITVPLLPIVVEAVKDDEKAGGKKKAAPAKKAKGGGAPAILTEELDANEPHPYTQNQTSVTLTVTFRHALTRLPQSRPRPALQPTDLIPTRLRPPRRPMDATKTFSTEIESLTQRIIKEYREHVDATGQSGEEGRAGFLNYLHSSGQAHAYRQVLIPAVQAVVKEKFLRQPNPSKEELNRVTNELYNFLTDTMHATIHRVFHHHEQQQRNARASVDGLSASERWKRRAMEAEVMREFALAAKYHQERLGSTKPDTVGDESLPNVWVEYAEFGLRVRDPLKAEQAFREALAVDYAHLPALVGYGLLLLNANRFQEAEVFLQSAVDLSSNMLTWGSLALLFELKRLALADATAGGDAGGDAANEAKRVSFAREAKYAITQATRYAESSGSNAASQQEERTPSDVYEHVARRCMDLSLEDLANLCLVKCKPSDQVELLYAKCFYQSEQYDEAVGILEPITKSSPSATEPKLLLGDVFNAMGRFAEAEHQYNAALRIDPFCGSGPSYVRLGNMCASMGKFRDALAAFISGAKVWPCGLTWLGVGIAYYRMEDMIRAEQALNESNILNNLNPKTWAYLALLCLRQRRDDEADQALNQAVKLGLDDAHLLAEVGVEELRVGRARVAETCFRRSLSVSDDPNTHMQLGRALCVLKRFDEAREAFMHVAATSPSEAQRLKAEEQAAIIPQSATA